MRVEIIRIGNSHGLRLPKAILEQYGFDKVVELRVEGRSLIIEPVSQPRIGWSKAFQTMAEQRDDEPLLDETIATVFDRDEWAW
jgi:antitoxin MazE